MNKGWLKTHCFLTQIRRDHRGAIVVLVALMLPVLLGFAGLGVEVGSWFENRRDIQTIADAAAIAGAHEKQEASFTAASIEAYATAAAEQNDFDATTETLDINNPPEQSEGYNGESEAVEAIVTRDVSLLFASFFLDDSVTIRADAVASAGDSTGEACILSLANSGTGVTVTGSGDVSLPGCQVAVNSLDEDALTVAGAGGLEIECYSVVGSIDVTDGLDAACGDDGITGAKAITDPYADLTTPGYADPGDCHGGGGNLTVGNGETLILNEPGDTADFVDPYVICGDLDVRGTLTLNPGLYIIDGDFSANAQSQIIGNGVTIILKNGGNLTGINGGATINLRAPNAAEAVSDTSIAEWEGMLFYQDREAPICETNCNVINGNSDSTYEGVIYFPNQELSMLGGNETGTDAKCLQIVAYTVEFTGNNSTTGSVDECLDAGVEGITVPSKVGLVE